MHETQCTLVISTILPWAQSKRELVIRKAYIELNQSRVDWTQLLRSVCTLGIEFSPSFNRLQTAFSILVQPTFH
jgi:hypothetical protein